ncbi:hypothetical protein [Chamaesiphon sp. VAR_48_metabat_403]|uniref:hypothetical protein n=1 Tax=Chamaesiphon sp. VAR_48_metabat_403 TaxID=2964700 RepID=UPI00286DFF29|nr:hypothetical protein [Chamaesiphon sp. VAR_48_metabat_403]
MKNRHSNNPINSVIPLLALILVSIVMVGCDEKTEQQVDTSQEMIERQNEIDRNRQTAPEPSPTPSTPAIDPFYDKEHGKQMGH